MSERSKQHALLDSLMREGNKCFYCGKIVERYNDIFWGFGIDPQDGQGALNTFERRFLFSTMATVDHVIPRKDGGKTTRENCVLACFPCNQQRHRKSKKR